MIRETLLALGLLVLVLAPTSIATPTSGPPSWDASVANDNVTLGEPILIAVSGPAHGTFNVSLTSEFFVTTKPLFYGAYTLGNSSDNVTHAASMSVTIPTKPLTYGGYQLMVYNVTLAFSFLQPIIYLVSGVNETGVANNLNTVWEELNITTDRELSLLYQQSILQQQQEEYFWISVAEFIVLCGVIFWTRTGAAYSRWGRMIRHFFHGLIWGRTDSDPWEGGSAPNPVPQPDLKRVWVSNLFPECDTCTIPTDREEKILHLRQDHRVPEPKLGRDYEKRIGAVRLGMSKLSEPEPSMSRLYDAMDEIPSDAFAHLEKKLPPQEQPPKGRRFFRRAEGD